MTKTALVVGGAGGIGSEAVKQILEQGYEVVATVLNDAERSALMASVPGVRRVEIVDLGKGDATLAALKAICERIPDLTAVVCCAGYVKVGFVEFASLNDLRSMIEVNMISNVALYQASIASLRKNKGRLVYVSSLAGKYVTPTFGLYSASKFALEAMIDAMRRESMRWGVRVLAVEPGWVRTEMSRDFSGQLGADFEKLSQANRDLYRPLFDDIARIGSALESSGLDASVVAASIVEALQSAEPQLRYIVGDDAKEVIRRSREWSDEQIDQDFTVQLPAMRPLQP